MDGEDREVDNMSVYVRRYAQSPRLGEAIARFGVTGEGVIVAIVDRGVNWVGDAVAKQ